MIKEAVDALEKKNWERAHEIAQNLEITEAYWLHGILHTMEGDLGNAQYWYRRAGRPFPNDIQVEEEIKALKERLGLP